MIAHAPSLCGGGLFCRTSGLVGALRHTHEAKMSWIPSASLFSLTFHHSAASTYAAISGQNNTTMDVVPHRWQTHDVGLEHALVHFVARWIKAPHTISPYPHWSLSNHNGYSHYKDTAFQDVAFRTPDWGFEPGGVLFHQGRPARGAHVALRLETGGLRLPDGALLPIDTLVALGAESYDLASDSALQEAKQALATNTETPDAFPFRAHLLCFIAGYGQAVLDRGLDDFVEAGFHGLVQHALPAVAATALHGLKSHGRSGQDATRHVRDTCQQTVQLAHQAWLLRPNKALIPTRWDAGPLMDIIKGYVQEGSLPPALFEAGRACGALALGVHFSPEILLNPTLAKSAHDAVAHKAVAHRFTDAALRALAASPHLLRPLTARKALALASS